MAVLASYMSTPKFDSAYTLGATVYNHNGSIYLRIRGGHRTIYARTVRGIALRSRYSTRITEAEALKACAAIQDGRNEVIRDMLLEIAPPGSPRLQYLH